MSADGSKDGTKKGARVTSGSASRSVRKPYRSPKLTAYGSVQKLTNATTVGAKSDGGPSGMVKMV